MIFIFCHIVLQGHLGKLRVMGLRFFGVRLLRSFARFQFDRLIGQPSVHKAILLFLFLRVKAIMKDHIIGGIFDRPLFFERVLDHSIFQHSDRDRFRLFGDRVLKHDILPGFLDFKDRPRHRFIRCFQHQRQFPIVNGQKLTFEIQPEDDPPGIQIESVMFHQPSCRIMFL